MFLVVGILVGAIGLYLTYASNAATAPPASTKAKITGLLDRKGLPNANYVTYNGKPLVRNFVITVNWKDIEKDEGTFTFGPIDDYLDDAATLGSQVRLRIIAGAGSPDWAIDRAGRIPNWYDPTEKANYAIPAFWKPSYQQAYKTFLTRLSAQYDSNPIISEVTMAMCGTVYAEPLVRQSSIAANKTAAIAAGYTYSLDYSCLTNEIDLFDARSGIPAAGKLFKNTRVTFAVNPYQAFNPPMGRTAAQDTLNLMSYCRSRLGPRCVLGNNSIRSPAKSDGGYSAVYNKQKSLGKPLYYQTAQPDLIGNWQATLQWAVDQGASSVELNSAYYDPANPYDKAILATYAEKLRNNKY